MKISEYKFPEFTNIALKRIELNKAEYFSDCFLSSSRDLIDEGYILTGMIRFFERKDQISTEEIEEKPERREEIKIPEYRWDYFCHFLPSFLQRGWFKPNYISYPVVWNKYVRKTIYKVYDIEELKGEEDVVIRVWQAGRVGGD